METSDYTVITVQTTVNAPVAKVWERWTKPEHITQWSFASEEWYSPHAENDLKAGGKFKTGMAARDGSMGFEFEGVYNNVEEHKLIEYSLADGRKVQIIFEENGAKTDITERFDAEQVNEVEMQKNGWQAILDNFKKYTEGK